MQCWEVLDQMEMEMDEESPSRSTWVILVSVLAFKECARDCQNSADKLYLISIVLLCGFDNFVPPQKGLQK